MMQIVIALLAFMLDAPIVVKCYGNIHPAIRSAVPTFVWCCINSCSSRICY